uniref:Uncharacterized protein n=1 Tax=Oryza sativa subsp. japonica TaxID=39947 RepID=Q69XZ4_ORYSJ|nr:hypothetical protein [Oryza sativa Japonica Group]
MHRRKQQARRANPVPISPGWRAVRIRSAVGDEEDGGLAYPRHPQPNNVCWAPQAHGGIKCDGTDASKQVWMRWNVTRSEGTVWTPRPTYGPSA